LYATFEAERETVTELSYYKTDKSESGAAVTSSPEETGEPMVIIGDTKVYYNEAMVYLKMAQDNYEAEYGNNLWNADIFGNGVSFGKALKEEVVNQITELKVIGAKAKDLKIELTEEEQAEADSYAEEYYKTLSKEDKQRYRMTKELLQKVFSDNLLADKVFENETINVDTNVPDSEAKQITVQDIFIQNYNLDSSGKKVALSTEDKKTAYKKVKSLLDQAKKTDDFKSLAEANSEAEQIEYTFGHGKAPKEYGDPFEKAAFDLKTGQISSIITTDTGWHILYCVSDFNEDATTQVKEDIIEGRRNDMFSELYKEWSADYEVVVNNEAWDAIALADKEERSSLSFIF
jgi:foldase protein PrsA